MTDPPTKGARLPEITLEGPEGPVSLEALRGGRPLVVAFYVEEGTPTCTVQLNAFRNDYALIEEMGAVFVAISVDPVERQAEFARAGGYPFPLLADPELKAARAFGVADEREKRSQRAIFVSDREGVIVEAIPYYNPANLGQYQAVFAALGLSEA